jgi:FkbM family methyltransferase
MALGHHSAGAQWNFDVPLSMGHRMLAPANSMQSWRAAFTGQYDDEVIRFLTAYINPGGLVLDIGASLGFYTVPLAVAARSVNAKVWSIEPVPTNCAVLRQNIVRNGLLDTVDVLDVALGSAASMVDIHVEGSGAGNAAIADGVEAAEMMRHDAAGRATSYVTVRVSRLDDLPSSTRRCSLIKMDVEGYELHVLAGAEEFIEANRPAIFGEFSHEWLSSRGFATGAPLEWAASHGYAGAYVHAARSSYLTDRRNIFLTSADQPDPSAEGLLLLPCVDADLSRK